MLGNKRIAHTIHDHLVAGLLLVCMAGIGESAYAQDVQATSTVVTIEPVSTSRLLNEAGGFYEFNVVIEFLPTNATFFRGIRRIPLGFSGARVTVADASESVLDPRVTPTQDYSVSVGGVEQTLIAVRPTRPGTTYALPFTAIEFGEGLLMEPLPADRRLTRTVRLTAKDDGVDEGPNTGLGVGTEFITLQFNPDNPDGQFPTSQPSVTYRPFRSPIIIIDDDSNPPGVTVTPTTLTTTEGGMATFTVVLDAEPAGYEEHQIPRPFTIPGAPNQTVPVYELTNEVRVTVTSTDPIDGGLVSSVVDTTPAISTVLTFTETGGTAPWNRPQSVTVNAADNLVSGSDVIYDITFGVDGDTFTPGSEGRPDNDYDGVTVAAVSVTNEDNDGMHGVIVTETGGSTIVAEDGGTDRFTVALRSEPADDVVLTLTSSDTNEGTVDPPTLTFTPTGGTTPWNTPQTVTLTGVNDDIDSDDTFTVDFAITDEGGINYPITPSAPVVTVTATNDDTASTNITLAISPTGAAETADATEITITATLGGTVVLGTPTNIAVTVGAPGDSARRGSTQDYTGTSTFTLTIPALSLSATRTFSIDPVADTDNNNETITISGTASGFTFTPTTLTLTINDVGLSVFQNASGGMPISSTGLITGATEGVAHTFYVRLTRAPTGNVIVVPTSSNPTELAINTPSLTFTTANWNMRQAVSVTGVDDDVFRTDSGTTTATDRIHRVDFAVTTGDGNIYSNDLPLASVNVRVTEDDQVTLVLSAFPTDIPESAGPTTVTVTAMVMGSKRVSRQIVQNFRLLGGSPESSPGVPTGLATLQQAGQHDAIVTSPVRPVCGANCRTFGPVTIPPLGDRGTTTFTIDPIADTRDEGSERLRTTGDGSGYGVESVMEAEFFIVESGVLAFEALTGGASIDAVTIDEASSDILYVQLASQPATGRSVTISVASSDTNEGTVTPPATLTFTAADGPTSWDTRQPVTVNTINDNSDRDDSFTVDFAVTSGDGGNYPNDLSILSVTVNITDDDVAGIDAYDALTGGSEITTITTSETGAGNVETFYVTLTSEPTGTVTVTIGVDTTEHTLTTPASGTLTFDSTNWNTPRQAITITGVDDNVVDGDQTYDITLTATGGGYDGVVETVSVTNTDTDMAGLSIADMMVDEDGGTATVTVTLTPAVTAGTVEVDATTMDGTATIAGGDYTAITSQTLTFVAGNTSQTLDITINDDSIDEADETFTVTLDNLMLPTGITTASITDATATVTIIDDDAVSDTINLSVNPPTIPETAGATTITVTATLGGSGVVSPTETTVTVSVGGGTAASGTDYTAVPNFTLTIPALSSSAMGTFTIDPNTSSDNGDTVMITGTATINGMTAIVNSATLTIVEAGISVYDAMSAGTEISTATIAEASGSNILYVQLASQPATGSSVVIGVTSSDTNEGTVNMATLTFTDTNWNARQPVTVTAVPDDIVRDDTFTVDFAVTTGDGGAYLTTLTLTSVTVTITDDDTAGIALFDAATGNTTVTTITTGEPDTATTFYIELESQPTANVTVAVASDTAGEGQVTTGASLTFTTMNWNMRQAVTVTGQDDNTVDGAQPYTVTLSSTSTDSNYNALTETLSATNTDDDTAALSIADMMVNEDATTATVTLTLTPAVTAGNVLVDLTTADGTAEAGTDYTTITSQTLTFTAGSTSETLSITISDDNIAEGNETFTVMLDNLMLPTGVTTVSITDATATVTITDDETVPTTIALGISQLTIPETADATEITITATIDGTAVLPTETVVTVSVGGGTATSGTDYTAVPNFDLTIPALSLSATQTFMIDPTDDSTSDNNETVMITGTAGGFTVNAATLTILEAGILVFDMASGGTSTDTITIADENSGTMTFYVRLISAPASDITLSVMSSDTNEGTVMLPTTLTFTAATGTTSWDTRQAVTVTAIPDEIDRDDSFTVNFAVTTGDGGNYPTSLVIPSVTVNITDDDTAGIALFDMATGTDAPSITTTEGATTDSFYVVLESEPTGTVTVTISGLVAGEHTLDPVAGTLTFTPTGTTAWNTRQEITLTGVDDNVVDGDQMYDLTLTPTGGGYGSVTAPTVSVTNSDDDTAAISIADLSVDENAGTATLTVTLTPAVTAGDVMVDLTTTDGTATIAGGDYTAFTSETLTIAEGSTTQTLDIPINNDNIDELDETFTVTLDNLVLPMAVTGDVTITDATAMVTITDDDTLSDTIGLSVSPLSVAETADATTITVTATIDGTAVSTMPTTVTVSVGGGTATSGTDYAAVTDFTLTIPALSLSATQTFMIDPTEDTTDDNNETVMITGTAGGFTTINPTTLTIVEAGISVFDAMTLGNPISTITIVEASGTGMLYVQLASEPAASSSVTISVASSDTNEGTVTPTTLTFSDTNWDTRQLITVTAVDDNVDRDDTFMVNFAVTGGDGGNYTTSLTLPSVTVTITDDDTLSDTIGLSVSPLSVAETADATTITVTATIDGTAVSTMPTTVTVSVGGGTATSGTDYAAVTDFTLTIPALSLSATQTFMIDPTEDTTDDNNETVMITGTAGGFTTINPTTLTIVEAGISVFDAMTLGNPISTITIVEASGTGMLYVQLASEPAASSSVTISVASSDTNEGTVTPTTLTFSDTNWDTRQLITVTAVDDNVDRDDTFMVNFAVTGGDGGNYTTSLTLPSVTVTITDDDTLSDTIGLSVSPLSVAETADATTITVTATIDGTAVSTMPTTVTVSVGGGTATSGTDYAAVTDFTLTIPALSLSATQTFMIDPTEDTTDDNNETVMITGTAGGFTTINPTTLTIVEAGISVFDAMTLGNPISTITIVEASGTGMLYVQLASEPAASSSVTISVASSDTNEGTVTPTTLTFSDTNWDTRQLITVTAVDDNVDRDGDSFMVDFAVMSGDSGNYTNLLMLPSVTVTITDDDTASTMIALSISPDSIRETDGAADITVTAALVGATSTISTNVTVTVGDASDSATVTTDYTATPTTLTITIPELMTSGSGVFSITPVADGESDSDETITISGMATGFTINPATLTIVELSEEDQQAIEQTVAAQASGVTQVVTEQIGIRLISRVSASSGSSGSGGGSRDGGGGSRGGGSRGGGGRGGGIEPDSLTSIDWQNRLAKFTYEGLQRLDNDADIMSLDWLFKAAGGNGQVLMPLGAEALTLWATGARISTKGDGVADYEGDVNSFILGIDTDLANDWVVGVAISYNDSEVDYTMDGTPEAKTEQTTYSIHPYLSHTLTEGLTLWMAGGYGFGDVDFSRTGGFGQATSDITQWMAAGGLEKQIITNSPWQGALRIKGLWGNAEVDAAEYSGGGPIAKIDTEFWRARMESEMGYNFPLPGGRIRPYAIIGGRWDHNDAIVSGDEWHVDVGGGVEVIRPAFALNISLHTQVTEGDTEEDSIFATGSMTYDLEQDGQGLQIALSRPLNNTSPAWDSHSFSALADTTSGLSAAPLTSELAYGWTVHPFGLEGAIQTYIQNSFDSHDRHYAVGLELAVNALTLNFESGYHTNLDSETRGTGLESMLKTKIRW